MRMLDMVPTAKWGSCLKKDARFAPVFQRLIDAPEESLAALRADPAGFEDRALAEEKGAIQANAPLFDQRMLGFMLFDADGGRLPLAAPDWVPPVENFAALEDRGVRRGGSPRFLAVEAPDGRMLHLFWAPIAETTDWNLPARIRAAADAGAADRIALVTGGDVDEGPIDAAARGFNLTDLERRVVVGVVRTGNGRAAAALLGIAYSTAREALAAAARKMRQPNMPAVVHTVVAAAFGIFPEDFNAAGLLADMLQLSERQAQIALLVATGLSREETARAVGVSAAVVKKELELVFGNLGLGSAAELSRLIVEVQALRLFARSTDGAPGFIDPAIEPSRFAVRPNGRETIAWSDYGPASGKPVLIVHSNWSCRAAPRPLLRALQRRGWRPIAIDRPGFGATHPGRSTPQDPFTPAIEDTLQILDLLNIRRAAILARAGAFYVHALKSAAPDRVGPVVLVSPTVPTAASTRRRGIMGTMKDIFQRPQLIEFYFRVISAQLTAARIEQLTRAIVKGNAGDTALCDDPEFIRDRFRAVRPFTTGNLVGGINEQVVISSGSYAAAPLSATDWTVVHGDNDSHNSVADVDNYWRPVVPSASFVRLAGGGRFLTSSHPEALVDLL